MTYSFISPPNSGRFVLSNATLPSAAVTGYEAPIVEGLVRADIVIADGIIADVLPPGEAPVELAKSDLKESMVWPCFADMHTHLDKGHIWPRNANPDGTFPGALEAVRADREANWSAGDVKKRMEFSLRCAYAHGTSLIRTHLDSLAPQHRISFEVFAEMREAWKDRIALQAVALFPMENMADAAYFAELVAVVRDKGGLMGGVTRMSPDLDSQLDTLFRAAADNGFDVDLHVDETDDRGAETLKAIAQAVLRNRFDGKVTAGHCCSLARHDQETAKRTVALVAEAGIAVVSLPMCNMYLQDRYPGRTPRWRGVTLFKELAAAGVATAVASDNTRDPFYAYGDLDPVEVFREAVRILHLDHPLDTAARVVTTSPAEILGRPDKGRIAAGASADLVLFSARRWSEFLSRPQSDRVVLRRGKVIDRRLPDYRELDSVVGA
ncbi:MULTISPECIES: cytosine deaminase [Rhizobium]|uniref:cytosine deaminase n=1 Tax=Rhizobium TaxID=379 RepID=UPI0007EB8023|nr:MULTISPECIES: cytosine deaminase [Rhizobium]ANK85682.1 cytosine deaminase-like protein [Rhizobium sp. N731]ANK91594.1 cytosine deaminase-like protein [Rhizobium sp. N6212]ANK97628.1 cytosine deaminase-like protein [Rhizobium sp. N621]ANL03707.1 cytosine deaminase-like protein [Rhizobium esperanzae]ANL09753.1 cytosine deaminase-like protein [Rhizobium sp. N1341]